MASCLPFHRFVEDPTPRATGQGNVPLIQVYVLTGMTAVNPGRPGHTRYASASAVEQPADENPQQGEEKRHEDQVWQGYFHTYSPGPPPLIGSEAPGRVAWAIRRGADAHLLKPVGSGGIYSAVMIASRAYAMRIVLREKAEGLKARLDQRECLAQATAHLMASGNLSAQAAYRTLRLMAMSERLSIEKMAAVLLDRVPGVHKRSDRA